MVFMSYLWGISLMYGVCVLRMGYLSYVFDISLMHGILVLCFGKNTCHPGATMAECIVLCMGY